MAEIQSLARGLKILDLLGQAEYGASITELAAQLGVDKGTASRLVATLAGQGYAEKDENTRRYHLGARVVSLSRSRLNRYPLREAAKPFLRQLMEATGECAHLAIHAQGSALYIDQVESPATLRVNAQVGTLNPLHSTALGKVLLAFGDLALPEELPQYTPKTITGKKELREHLEQVCRQGYAMDDEEYDIGVRCIAVPIFDFRGKLAGTMGISGPATRLTIHRLDELKAAVLTIGKELSAQMTFVQ